MNRDNFQVQKAKKVNIDSIQYFLEENKLRPKISIDKNSIYFFVQSGEVIIGTIGAEINQRYALIKSAGVSMDWRRKGIAQNLFEILLDELKSVGVEHMYLFSRQAPEFWTKMGFTKCEIQEVTKVLSETNQVKEFIEDNSIWTDVAWYRAIAKKNDETG